MPSVNLYNIPQVIQLATSSAMNVNTSSALNRTDFNVFKHVTNDIDFLIKDIDRKPVSLVGKSVVFYAVDDSNDTIKLQKNLQIINPIKGHCRLVLHPGDSSSWDSGYLRYSVLLEQANGTQTMVYMDQGREIRGYFEVLPGPLPKARGPLTIASDSFVEHAAKSPTQPTKYVTQAFHGAAQRDNKSGVHALAVYTTKFSGKIKTQASLNNSYPTEEHQWFDVVMNTPTGDIVLKNYTGIEYATFVGNFMWVRFSYELDAAAFVDQETAKIDKVVFRN